MTRLTQNDKVAYLGGGLFLSMLKKDRRSVNFRDMVLCVCASPCDVVRSLVKLFTVRGQQDCWCDGSYVHSGDGGVLVVIWQAVCRSVTTDNEKHIIIPDCVAW